MLNGTLFSSRNCSFESQKCLLVNYKRCHQQTVFVHSRMEVNKFSSTFLNHT